MTEIDIEFDEQFACTVYDCTWLPSKKIEHRLAHTCIYILQAISDDSLPKFKVPIRQNLSSVFKDQENYLSFSLSQGCWHCVVFLVKKLNSHSASFHPNVTVSTGRLNTVGNPTMD